MIIRLPFSFSFRCLFLLLMAAEMAYAGAGDLAGRVRDSSGAIIPGARVTLRTSDGGGEQIKHTDAEGEFVFPGLASGSYEVHVSVRGFAPFQRTVEFRNGREMLEIWLTPASFAQELQVTASRIVGTPEEMERLPGSYGVLGSSNFAESRVFTTDEALRKIPGLHTRGEEGFGLRPNIGIRGLSPTRSSQVLLLEDGLPLAFAPYGDNASYYHPPIERFDGLEVVKGGGQIVYGPRTVGAVINYLTPAPPEKWSGSLTLAGGNRNYANGHLRLGGTWRKTGVLLDLLRKQGQGARENLRHGLNDFNVKTLTALTPRQTVGFRLNSYMEDSQVTYSGLRESEYQANPRANPFSNDHFDGQRFGASVRHSWAPRENLVFTTSAYGTRFSRDWWRQSSNSNQRPNDAADPVCGGMANLHSTCGNEGRLRDYATYGFDSKGRAAFRLLGLHSEADFGVRWHFEDQERRQENGALPTSRSGVLVENNERKARAFSFFVQDGLQTGRWRFTPGVRVERIQYQRTNRLGAGGAGVTGEESLLIAVPGFGVNYGPSEKVSIFAGFHRGFAPPRVEDVINNSTGASIDLGPEKSWNFEAGIRLRPSASLRLEATTFRMDFENQIVPGSVAGGIGATLTNAGETLHQGLELAGQYDWRSAFGSRHGLYLRGAYTWLPVAKFSGTRFSNMLGFATISVAGNRLPYAPENLLTTSVGFLHRRGPSAQLEMVYTGQQFGDDLNTVTGTADGQRGLLPGNALWNFTLNYPMEGIHSTFYVTVKNLFNRTVIVDRARGLLPGIPRLVQAGIHWDF